MHMNPGKKKWLQLAIKSELGQHALEGRGACVELRRGVAITEVMGKLLWWGGPKWKITRALLR